MKKHFSQVVVYLLLATTLVIFLVVPQSVGRAAAQSEPPIPEPNSIVKEYARIIGISHAEAEHRLRLQNEMSDLARKVIEGEPTYAGSWVQHQPTFGLVVAFTASDGAAKIRKYLAGVPWSTLVQVQHSKYTIGELNDIFAKVTAAATETKLPFAASANYQTGKVDLYTPQLEALHSQLIIKDALQPFLNDITFVYQANLAVPAELKYPYLLGGHGVANCTTGFAVVRNSDNRRFMSTAGHCPNDMYVEYGGSASVYLGPVVFENDPESNVGSYGDDVDLQMHDVSARSMDLTNVIRAGSTSTEKVIGTETKATTLNAFVCKYGRVTGQTCGYVVSINYIPGGVYGTSNHYVLVYKAVGAVGDMACPGDSGAPVYKYVTGASGVIGLGVFSGREDVPCTGNNVDWYVYTPVDEVNRVGFSILTTAYQQYFTQPVWWTETNCTEYKRAMDDNGNPTGLQTSQPCSTSLPAGSTGTIESYDAYSVGGYWRETLWRGGIGYTRKTPLTSYEAINWGAAQAWGQCCSGTGPRAQAAFVVGNYYYQNVWWTESTCTEYKRALDNNGNPTGAQTNQPCGTSAPASGTIQSYNAFAIYSKLRETMWRNNICYLRDVPLNATNTNVNWSSAPAWGQCGSGTGPRAQGGDLLAQP